MKLIYLAIIMLTPLIFVAVWNLNYILLSNVLDQEDFRSFIAALLAIGHLVLVGSAAYAGLVCKGSK